jgi:hypothetical protein
MKPEFIILHHSATKDAGTVSWGAIRKYHKSLGWDDIGYHYGLELVGDEYEILIGRPWFRWGAHTIGMNQNSLGVCVVGNYDTDELNSRLLLKLSELLISLQMAHNIPDKNIQGHRVYANKSCPGEKLFAWMKDHGKGGPYGV